MVILSHATGNQNVRALTGRLAEVNALAGFYTTVAISQKRASAMPVKLRDEALRRNFSIPEDLVHTRPLLEISRLVTQRAGIRFLSEGDDAMLSVFSVWKDLDAYLARRLAVHADAKTVYCYDDGARSTFSAAKKLGKRCVYECPTSHWKTWLPLFEEERDLAPDWAASLGVDGISDEKIERKQAEFDMADLVVCPSSFAYSSIRREVGPDKRIVVVPYGSPHQTVMGISPPTKVDSALKVLFVGGINQKKGMSYLSEAISQLGDLVELTLIGRANVGQCAALDKFILSQRWMPSLPHQAVMEQMRNADVLVLPSLSDGFGLVILEAMSCGIPVIATTNTGGPDVIVDGVNGYVVPIRSSSAIRDKLELLARDRDLLQQMKIKALETAAAYNWRRYGDQILGILAGL